MAARSFGVKYVPSEKLAITSWGPRVFELGS